MAVDNPRGGTCTESFHPVKTLIKAIAWYENCVEDDLPIQVYQQDAGGRIRVKIYNKDRKLLMSRG